MPQSGNAVPRSRLFLISSVYLPKARSIFLLKCSLRSLIESISFSSWYFLLLLNDLRFSSLSFNSCTILSILSSEVFGAYNERKDSSSQNIQCCTEVERNNWCFGSIPFHIGDLKLRGRILDQLLSFYCILPSRYQFSWSVFCMHCIVFSD